MTGTASAVFVLILTPSGSASPARCAVQMNVSRLDISQRQQRSDIRRARPGGEGQTLPHG